MQYGATQCLKSILKKKHFQIMREYILQSEEKRILLQPVVCMYIIQKFLIILHYFFLFLDYCVTTKYGNDGGGEVR